MVSSNPFRSRHSDTPGEYKQFAGTFAPQVLQWLPDRPWNQLIVIRSAPGAGKTSLMKALSADTLTWIARNSTIVRPTYDALSDFNAITDDHPTLLGLRVSLKYDFLSLADVGDDVEHQQRLVNRLLDARIMSALLRAALHISGRGSDDIGTVQIVPDAENPRAVTALQRLGSGNGKDLQAVCDTAENDILDVLDRLIVRDQALPDGHQHLYSMQALCAAQIFVEGNRLDAMPLIMLDEGQNLSDTQRSRLLTELADREITVARFLGVQSRVMSDNELIGAGQQGRDYEVIELESFSRERTGKSQTSSAPVAAMTVHRYRAMLIEIADKRGSQAVSRMIQGDASFSDFFITDHDENLERRYTEAAEILREELRVEAGESRRYREWLDGVDQHEGRVGAARLGELKALIARDRNRAQQELFADELVLPSDEIARRGDSSLREAALLAIAHRFKLPYYHGQTAITRLASSNIEQFLELCGDMFAHLQIRASANKPVELDAAVQDKLVREASDRYWRQLERLPNGYLVQRLVERIAEIAATEAAKPTIPYPPGVTGTALSMADRQRLIAPTDAARNVGAAQLRAALSSAVAHNVVWLDPDYSVKGDRWLVIYLNRLLCPRFRMPLTLGGFREKPLRAMAGWFIDVADGQGSLL